MAALHFQSRTSSKSLTNSHIYLCQAYGQAPGPSGLWAKVERAELDMGTRNKWVRLSGRRFLPMSYTESSGFVVSTKLNARQRADLLVANISTNRISLPQGQSYTEGKYNNGSLN